MEKNSKTKQLNEFTVGMQHFHRYLNDFVVYKKDFELHQNGSTMIIECDGKKWRFIDYGGITGKGFHLCKFVTADAKEYVESCGQELFKPENLKPNVDLEVQKANLPALAKAVGQQIYSIDVNDCYWDTAYRMGVIKQDTYLRGLKNKDWKVGRNASIGALSKITVVTKFVGGVKTTAEPLVAEERLAIVRNNIVYKVHEMFLRLLKQLGDGWLMYFTDCVYVPLDKVAEVRQFFLTEGYQTKEATFQLDKVDTVTGRVDWYDYEKIADKHFQFCQRQLSLDKIPLFDAVPEVKATAMDSNTEFLNQKE